VTQFHHHSEFSYLIFDFIADSGYLDVLLELTSGENLWSHVTAGLSFYLMLAC